MAPTQPQGILIGPEEGPVGGLYGSPLVLVGLVPPPANEGTPQPPNRPQQEGWRRGGEGVRSALNGGLHPTDPKDPPTPSAYPNVGVSNPNVGVRHPTHPNFGVCHPTNPILGCPAPKESQLWGLQRQRWGLQPQLRGPSPKNPNFGVFITQPTPTLGSPPPTTPNIGVFTPQCSPTLGSPPPTEPKSGVHHPMNPTLGSMTQQAP